MTDQDWHPSFLVIGAVKAATTWIQMRLRDNPRVFMPVREPHYFSTEFERGETYYQRCFVGRPDKAEAIGEKSADYLAHPLAARRVAAMLPHARLVVQLRDPVERAYSDYKMLYRRGTVTGPPEDYLTSLDNPAPRFLENGLYAGHLARWLDHFAPEQVLIFLYEDVNENPQDIVDTVSRHIGVDPVFCPEAVRRRENNSREALLPLRLRLALAPFKDAVRSLRGNTFFESARSLLAREMIYPPLSADLRARLVDFYARDIEALERLCSLDLAVWRADHARQSQAATPAVPARAFAGRTPLLSMFDTKDITPRENAR